ncbi:MAG: LysR family transcriptional regulator [Pleomorphochaeta sp.]
MLDYKVKTFLELCKCMNYRITAERLNMSQPSVTQHIHLLEDYYNHKLFYYDKKKLIKTESAIVLEKHFQILVNNQLNLERELNEKGKVIINIGATKTIGNYVINEKIISLVNNNNKVTFLIDNTKSLFDKLHDNQLDLLIIEGLFDKSKYDSRLFKKEAFVGICNKKHEFANKEIEINKIIEKGLVLREKGSGTRNILERELFKNNYTINSFKTVHCISSFELIKNIISETDYITFAYKSILKSDSNLAEFRISNLNIVKEFNFVALKNTDIDSKISCFNS